MWATAASTVPTHWCNFVFDYPQHANAAKVAIGVHHDGPRRVNVVPQQPLSLGRQSYNTSDPLIAIPEELQGQYGTYRPTPLRRAHSLENRLGANARIYYKFEGANITGSHKLNTALAQAYYYSRSGVRHLVTGTGAGQWGTALAYACQLLGMQCTVFMVGASLRQKPQRASLMRVFGATVHESPSGITDVGRQARQWDLDRTGTLAVATGEALELARAERKARFAVGSGENCVLLHQTIAGSEAVNQMDELGDNPDWVVACMGAGSNFAGIGLPFLRAAKQRKREVKLLAVESMACPRLTRGKYAYDVNDLSGTTPLSRMYSLGSTYVPPPVYAGGLRYHGCSPFLSAMYAEGLFDARAIDQLTVLDAGLLFAQTEGILPAPESAHAVAGTVELVREHPQDAAPLVVLMNISGHGLLDISAYERYLTGHLDMGLPDENAIAESLRRLEEFGARVAIPAVMDRFPARD